MEVYFLSQPHLLNNDHMFCLLLVPIDFVLSLFDFQVMVTEPRFSQDLPLLSIPDSLEMFSRFITSVQGQVLI